MLSNFLTTTNINFIKFHKLTLSIIIALILISATSLLTRGLNLGIDFSGGILIEARLQEKTSIAKIRNTLDIAGIKKANIQNFDEKDIMIKIAKGQNHNEAIKLIQETLSDNFPEIEYRKIDFVGPQIGSELITKGFLAIILSFLSIMIYIWVRFDWQFGVGAITAIIHDIILTFGFFSISQLEFNTTSIAALLTIIGYSINDSVVIYDRIRENLIKFKKMELKTIINNSLNSTLSRTVLTSGMTLISLLALILFGGEILKSFSMAVFFGIIIGTFSSIFISAPILLYIDPRKTTTKKIDDKA
jgi:preprotein translocase subunit SecF